MSTIRYPLYLNTNYITNEKFVTNRRIFEYDISKANINILYSKAIIDKDLYDLLYRKDKKSREIYIGYFIKDNMEKHNKNYGKVIREGIEEMRKKFFSENDIRDDEVIRIANDAIYVTRPYECTRTSFKFDDNDHFIEFKLKNEFQTMVKLGTVVIFIYDNGYNYNIDVKGIGDELLDLHKPMLSAILNLINCIEKTDKNTAMREFYNLYIPYMNMELPAEYYREFNNFSSYRFHGLKEFGLMNYDFNMNSNYKLDISYNQNILRELYGLIIDMI